MEKIRSRTNQTTITNNNTPVVRGGRPQSPHLIRSGSRSRGSGAILTSNIISSSTPQPAEVPPLAPIHSSIRNSSTTTTTTTATISRSKSTTKTRKISKGEEENSSNNNLVGILSQRYQFNPNSADPIITGRKLKSNNTNNSVPPITKPRSRSATNPPSAWALSPGRTPLPSPMSKSLDKAIGSGNGGGGAKLKSSGGGAAGIATSEKVKSGGGISVVLKYFRSNKKVSSIQEEAFHRYRVLHTRLVQWRLVNARAEIAIVNKNSIAEKKLFNVWLRTYQLRNSVLEKRMQVQKLKNEIKLLRVINPELRLLNEWTKIEKRNTEAVAKLSRNLMASSFRLPLIKGAKAETVSMYKVMYTALNVMNDIEETMERSFFEAEEKVLLVNELKKTIRLETEGLEELRKTVSMVAALEAQEKSLRVYVIQTAKEGFVER